MSIFDKYSAFGVKFCNFRGYFASFLFVSLAEIPEETKLAIFVIPDYIIVLTSSWRDECCSDDFFWIASGD